MRAFVCALALIIASCADDDPGPGPGGGAPGGGAVASGGGGSGGQPSGGGGGDAPGGGGAGPTLACDPLQSALSGSVGATDLSGTFDVLGQGYGFGARLTFHTLGGIFLHGVDRPYPTEPVAVEGLLRMPEEGPDPGAWYCAGPGSQFVTDGAFYADASLAITGRLGACPGAGIDGQIDICFDDPSCGGGSWMRGELDGAEVDFDLAQVQGYGELGSTRAVVEGAILWEQGGLVTLEAVDIDPRTTEIATSALGNAFFVVPQGTPDAGAVYCAGEGSTLTYAGGPIPIPLSAELRGLSRVGSCDDVQREPATIAFCMNQAERR
jgi:hypothetical protein